jgi:hypothetical protein
MVEETVFDDLDAGFVAWMNALDADIDYQNLNSDVSE